MHSEYTEGLVLRPMMDAGYTAWRDGVRVGAAQLLDDDVVVEAADEIARRALVRRLAGDARAAGITLRSCGSSSQEPPARSGDRSSGFFARPATKSAA